MKAPNLPVFRLSWPVPQVGQTRGSEPSSFVGKMCGPSALVQRVQHLAVMRSSPISPVAAWKSLQNSRSSTFQSSSPAETRSSFPPARR